MNLRMLFFLGLFVGWLWFGETQLRNSGIVLLNSNGEVFLEQNNLLGVWGFPTEFNVNQTSSYLQAAIQGLQAKTSLRAEEDYTLLGEGCKYRHTLHFFGTLHTTKGVIGADTYEWFSVFHLPPKRSVIVQDWIDDGMPVSCGLRDEL